MTTGEFRDSYTPFPLPDSLSSALDAFCDEENTRRAESQQSAIHPEIAPIQRVIAEQYDQQVVPAQEQIWDDTKTLLARSTPQLEARGACTDRPHAELRWNFFLMDTARELGVTTTFHLYHAKLDAGLDETEMDEYNQALRYVGLGNSAFHRGKVPDELLGVPAEGKGRNKTIPHDKLAGCIAGRALAQGNLFHVTVEAMAPGSDTEKRLLDFYFDPSTDASDRSNSLYLLEPEAVDTIYDDLWTGRGAGGPRKPIADPTLDDVHGYLYDLYIKDGVGQKYRDLAAVNELVARSQVI